jgi:uncharacterized repeat protein (TIGR04076 family)
VTSSQRAFRFVQPRRGEMMVRSTAEAHMSRRYPVRVTLVSQLKKCPNGHSVGDQWVIERKTPGGMCLSAFNSLMPFVMTLRFGGNFPWERDGEATVCCPDPEVVNVFRLERAGDADAEG